MAVDPVTSERQHIHALVEYAIHRRASDVVVKAGTSPALRIDGRLTRTDLPILTGRDARELAREVIDSASRDRMLLADEGDGDATDDSAEWMHQLSEGRELDTVFTVPGLVRVRCNLFLQRGAIGAALRIIPLQPYTIDELNLPAQLKTVALEPQGLVIVTGPTGSGKTTTMAALIEQINRNVHANIFTVEDPVEYVFQDKLSLIHQREVGSDTSSFDTALRSVMRQSPDVIAIGELRDRETVEVAMQAAEIGHLVLTTLHTTSAAATIDRIVNRFPEHLKRDVCQQLAASLLCVSSQRLVRRSDGKARVPAVEVMTVSPTVRKQLEDGDTTDLNTAIANGSHFGMITINQALCALCKSGRVTSEEATAVSSNVSELRQMLRGL
ncbi:MAG: PilT/PilU family type 4a pilus ATPase [Armatimonadetes bacterium]|nr:PilT/PilU family type 4a pilus ATPase [Armatimonadota bacterium]MDE2207125.1 PilT/PilU family type 4a pilus ATPase [Armatimonadota bacterium]